MHSTTSATFSVWIKRILSKQKLRPAKLLKYATNEEEIAIVQKEILELRIALDLMTYAKGRGRNGGQSQ